MKPDFLKRILAAVPALLTGIVLVFLTLLVFVVLNIENGLNDTQMWIKTGVGYFLQILMIILWLPEGKKRGESDEAYVTTKNEAEKKIQSASQNSNYDILEQFCQKATDENVRAYISRKVMRKYNIKYSMWLDSPDYMKQFDPKIQAWVRKVERQAAKRVRPIKATEITSVSDIELVYDVANHTNRAEYVRICIKVFTSFASSIIGGLLGYDRAPFSWNSVLRTMYWVLIIGMTIFYAIRTGYNLIAHEKKDYLQRMADFLNRFEAWKTTQNVTEK